METPETFLSVVIHEIADCGDDLALCAGFERGVWRAEQFADHIMEWLPEFALKHSETEELGVHNAISLIRRAAKTVYQSEKYGKRGEFGEILLHIAIRQVFDTLPAISKIYYKSTPNETVKGFDAVHVVRTERGLQLWIGETKFYKDLSAAIRDVTTEIVDHLRTDYLRSEFILIGNKVDPTWPEAADLDVLLSERTSLDVVFANACIPVLLTYESTAIASSSQADDAYAELLREEVIEAYENLRKKLADLYYAEFKAALPIVVHVFLIPLGNKADLVAALDRKLKGLQA